jgi:hypothetical protein
MTLQNPRWKTGSHNRKRVRYCKNPNCCKPFVSDGRGKRLYCTKCRSERDLQSNRQTQIRRRIAQ